MSDGQPHTKRRLERTQLYLMAIMCTLTVALGIFIGIVAFAQPVRVDIVIPLVQRFRNFGWFKGETPLFLIVSLPGENF
jgi:hypothetical protein